MSEEGPDRTEMQHEYFVNTIAKYYPGIREDDPSTICTHRITVFGPRYWVIKVLDLQYSVGCVLHRDHTVQ